MPPLDMLTSVIATLTKFHVSYIGLEIREYMDWYKS